MLKPRSLARRLAFQYIFMLDLGGADQAQTYREFLADNKAADNVFRFAEELFTSWQVNKSEIDDKISASLENWDFARVAAVELNILRLACAELELTTPYRVIIDEAINLAKAFASKDSYRFINGILDNLCNPERQKRSGATHVSLNELRKQILAVDEPDMALYSDVPLNTLSDQEGDD